MLALLPYYCETCEGWLALGRAVASVFGPDLGSLDHFPENALGVRVADILSHLLKSVRVAGSLRFGMAISGPWYSEGKLPVSDDVRRAMATIPFHIIAQGECWVSCEGQKIVLGEGDILAFPLCHDHVLGLGEQGPTLCPMLDLQRLNSDTFPMLRYGEGALTTRILCGFIFLDALNFSPLRDALPQFILARAADQGTGSGLLRSAAQQIIAEVDAGTAGGQSVIERLTEVILIELLRGQMQVQTAPRQGLLAAMTDPDLRRCLIAFHDAPHEDWTGASLARAGALSRTIMEERFKEKLGTSPMRYVREWRLYLASQTLASSNQSMSRIAETAGYGTEAAFVRAFTKQNGMPPGKWRNLARQPNPLLQ